MKTLLLGGTGSIGGAVLNCLLDRGHEVLALGRSPKSLAALESAGANPLEGDICSPESWVSVVDSADCVIHVAAIWDDAMGEVDRHLVDVLLKRLQRSDEARRFIYTGGCWMYGATGDVVATEETPFDALPSFAWSQATMQTVLSAPGVHGMVVHPAMVYERDGGVFRHIVEDAITTGQVRIYGGENVRWPLIHKDDLAMVYALMMEQGKSGDVYNASTIDGMPIGILTRAIAARHGVRSDPVVVDVATVQAEMGDWAEGYALDQQMSGKKAMDVLGWRPEHLDVLQDVG